MFFKDIYGNTAVKHHLVRMVEDNRLSHAILFSGQEGDAKLLSSSIIWSGWLKTTG